MLKKLLAKREEGFTLIEIVLVLAIAGLIMVIVFAAVAGAQAARRDTQRRSDVNRMRAALEQYAVNNNGSYPTGTTDIPAASPCAATTTTFCDKYLGGSAGFKDPGGSAYVIAEAITAPTAASGTIAYKSGNICAGNAMTTTGAQTRNYAILYYLEQGGVTCVNN